MTQDNFDKIVQVLLPARPFRPFTIELANGGRMEINHPEALSFHGDGLYSCLSSSKVRSAFEVVSVVRIINVTGTS
jgi:hypothetical protein